MIHPEQPWDPSMSVYLIPTYIGKRSPKGVVIKKLQSGKTIGHWFIPVDAQGKMGAAKTMPDFKIVPDEDARYLYTCAGRLLDKEQDA